MAIWEPTKESRVDIEGESSRIDPPTDDDPRGENPLSWGMPLRCPGTVDAEVWADDFMRCVMDRAQISKGLMLGWFAKAIMAGYDEAKWEESVRLASDDEKTKRALIESEAETFTEHSPFDIPF